MSKRRDPNKPRGKMSAYNIFVKEETEAMKKSQNEATGDSFETNEDKTVRQAFIPACAEKWKKLTEGEKKRFVEAAEKDRIRYNNEMANYTPPPKYEGSERKTRKQKKLKDPNKPKKWMSSFMFFCQDKRTAMREENSEMTLSAKMLGEMWAKMEEKEKEKFEKMAKEDRGRYEEEMKAFRKGDFVVPGTSQLAMEAEE